jgi:HD superfamily phosphohydrolase
MELIDTPEFQRLRAIGQLTPVDFVFPGATHSRFAHSIGATHVMGMILRQPAMQRYFLDGREELIQLLRLAALLHDVGHLPFSHVGEMAWNAAGATDAFAYDGSADLSVFDVAANARAKPPLHEELSVLLIRHSRLAEIIDSAVPDIDGTPASEVVARIVGGLHPDLVGRNLLSSDLDCDRLDYLSRVSISAGLVYGNIDLSYLIENLVVVQDPVGEFLVAIDGRHGLLVGEHFLLARYYHYAQFISHKTVASAEIDLVAGIVELIRLGDLPPTELLRRGAETERVAAVLGLTDARVTTALADAPVRHADEEDLIEASRRLFERRLLKAAARDHGLETIPRAGDPRTHPWDTRLRRHTDKLAVAGELGVDPRTFVYRRTALPLTGIEGDLAPSTFVESAGPIRDGVRKAAKVSDGENPPRLLITTSPVLQHLSHHQWATRRIYFREDLELYQPRSMSLAYGRVRNFFEAERA